jgi:hypothetical protein
MFDGAQGIVDYLIRQKLPYAFGLCGHGNILVGPTRVPMTQNLALNEGIRVVALARAHVARWRRGARLGCLVRLRLSVGSVDRQGRRKGNRRHEHRSSEKLHDGPPCYNGETEAAERIIVCTR